MSPANFEKEQRTLEALSTFQRSDFPTLAEAARVHNVAILREQRQPKARKLRKALPRLGITLGEPVD